MSLSSCSTFLPGNIQLSCVPVCINTLNYSNRLVAQLKNRQSCGYTERCLAVADIPSAAENSGAVGSGSSSEHYQSVPSYIIRVVESNITEEGEDLGNATNTAQSAGPGEDEDILRVEELSKHGKIIPAERGCVIARSFFTENNLPWSPDCDCDGYYKPVQCLRVAEGGLECWCSTRSGNEVMNSRRMLNCTDPREL